MELNSNNSFKFSIIMAVYNVEDYLNEAIDSIINQSIGFEENVQLILVDDGSTDRSKDISRDYEEKYPNNIIFLSKENGGQASARNLGLEYAKGKYLNFLDSDDYISKDTLKNVYQFFEEHYDEIDVVSIPIVLFERATGEHRLNFKYKETKVVDLEENPEFSQLSAASAFFKRESFKFQFDTEVLVLEDTLLINKLFLEKGKYGVVKDAKYYYRQRYSRDSSVDKMQSNKKYFTHRFKYFFKQLIDYAMEKEGHVPKFIQYVMLYDFQWTLKIKDLDIFDTQEEIEEFWHYFNYTLNSIDEDVILNTNFYGYTQDNKYFLLYLKNKSTETYFTYDNVYLKAGEHCIDNLKRHTAWMDIIEIKDNYLNISGLYNSCFSLENISFLAIKKTKNGAEEFKSKYIDYSTSRKTVTKLGIPWMYLYSFDIKVPINLNENTEVRLKLKYEENGQSVIIDPIIQFSSHADLSNVSHYTVRDSNMILFKGTSFNVLPYSYKNMLRFEFSSLRKMFSLKRESDEPHFWTGIFYRLLYLILFPFMRNKKIWLFLDRPDFADDNSKHLFKYAVLNKDDDIRKYFIVKEDSEDYKKIKELSTNVIPFRSFKHRLLYLFAEKLIISYTNVDFVNPFYDMNQKFYSGLITSKKYFFPHGITKEDISKYIKKFNKNLSLFSASSEMERESLFKESYNYDSDVIQVLGLPRHDGLTKEVDNKQILFMPSWREDLKGKDEDYIMDSPYFKRINGMFNNKKLIEAAEKYGYKLIFKPHPEIIQFVNLFDCDNIIISTEETYQELINPSSLMITDYSGTFFDFSYLKKPVIYYQGDEDYHYEEGYWDYETMGFGEVIFDEERLVNKIIYYMENGCIMEEKYKERVDMFFKYHDKNNCKRAYEWVYSH